MPPPTENEIKEVEAALKAVDLHPWLQEVVKANGLKTKKLTVGLKIKDNKPDLADRSEVLMYDGEKGAIWKVPSLRGLFRGDKPAPTNMYDGPPPAYMPMFYFIEHHVLTFCDGLRDRTDGEFEEAFSNLRRRPDGKSLSDLHFFLWQVAAGLLGTRPLSAAEFDAIIGRLAQSGRTFRMGGSSRNYIATLRGTLGQM